MKPCALAGTVSVALLLSGSLPNVTALEQFGSIGAKDDGLIIRTRYSAHGSRRILKTLAQMPEDFELADDSTLEQDRANAFTETRIMVIDGRIVDSQGFTVATDKRSALLSRDEIVLMLSHNPDHLELYLEWEVTGL